ncbi:Nucleoside-diphosphate-sugar epimerase [Paenibacillus algorifonticola]|uniref:Nucleoside-diphosphate-sugar epimerase n=1 Tax=Paenibacillus algorifonticola TaxID=684063 RepID=A0A1I2D3W8_9BACL|nr:NAD-dependent epimerase/dehydratase family protein [Paenibacillus algorifonticola]SFE75228.1 Nucleoside-diphosphate-sugar epimerase [Paenibacillus algorifonticola]
MKIFLTGVTGYIGGSVAKSLLEAGHSVYGLTRSTEQAAAVKEMGVEPVIGSLEDTDMLTQYAQLSDAVIHTADSGHRLAIDTFIRALHGSGKAFVHTSGSGVIGDDAKGEYESQQIYDEDTPFVPIDPQKERVMINEQVRKAGVEQGIRSIVIAPSMIYGTALGLPRESVQLPLIIRKSKEMGAGVYIGEGVNRWSNVHIKDLAELYLLAVENAPAGSFFFAENGEQSYKELAHFVSEALGYGGHTASWSMEEAVGEWGGVARYALATNSRVRAVHARKMLEWEPTGESIQSWISNNV